MADEKSPLKKIGKYEVIEELGRGAMGVVYKARDPFIGRLVALKTISPGLLDNPELLKRFYREAQAAGGLQHPNIVIIYDLGEADGLPYIAMEFLEGEPLEKVISRKPLMPLAQKLNVIMQLSRGLDYAHKRGIVHRDIKPGNIMVVKDGTVKVVDFGIVRLTDSGPGGGTKTGMVIGTVGYMSPEQIHGEHVDARSDLFSVGVVMYEFFSYQKPFTGKNLTQVLLNIINEDPTPLAEVAPQVPPHLAEVVHKALNKDPEERYQSLEEMVLELEPITRSLQKDMVDELVKQSQDLVNKKEFTQAREVLRNALMVDSSHGLAKTLMGQVSGELRRVETYPKIQELLNAGENLLKEGNYEEAAEKLEEVVKLDSQHGQAQEMLDQARQQLDRIQRTKKSLEASRRALKDGDYTIAESELQKVFEVDPQNPDAQALLGKIQADRAQREKRTRLNEALRQCRNLLIQMRYQDCLNQVEDLLRQYPDEAELKQLQQTAREGLDESTRAQVVATKTDEARKLLVQQEYSQALTLLNDLLKAYPNESSALKLRQLVEQEQKEADKQKRLETEVVGLKDLIDKKEFGTAVQQGERLQKEFPDDTEIGRLLAFARAERKNTEQDQQVTGIIQNLQGLLAAGKFEQAQREADKALKKFPDHPELKGLLEDAQKKRKDRAKKSELERRIRAMKGAIERGDLTDAIDLGHQTIAEYPKDTDVTQLLSFAEKEYQGRDKKKKRDDQLKTVVAQLENKDFDGATMMLKGIEKEFPFDPQVKELLKAAETHEYTPGGTLIGGPLASDMPAENVYIMEGPPSAASPAAPGVPPPPQPGAAPQPEAKASAVAPTPAVKPGVPLPPAKPEAKPAVPAPKPEVKPAPPPPRPEVKPAPKLPVAPPPEVEVPLWKKPAVIGVLALVLVGGAVGGYFALRGPGQATPAELQLQQQADNYASQKRFDDAKAMYNGLVAMNGALAGPAQQKVTDIDKMLADEKTLFAEAQAAFEKKDYATAKTKFQQVADLHGTREDEARQAASNADKLGQGADLKKLEQDNFNQAQAALRAGQYEKARALFANVHDPTLKPQAEQQLKAIDARLAEDRAFRDASDLLAQSKLDEAKKKFQQVAGLNGSRRSEALTKIQEIDKLGTDAAAKKHLQEDQQKLTQLEGRLTQARQQSDENALKQLQSEFRQLAQAGGPLASNARDYAEKQIPTDLQRLADARAADEERQRQAAAAKAAEEERQRRAAAAAAAAAQQPQPQPTPTQPAPAQPTPTAAHQPKVAVMPSTARPWTGPLSPGQNVGAGFIDGGLQLVSNPIPPDLASRAQPSSKATILVNVDEQGGVTPSRALQDTTGLGQALLDATKSWKFNPPRVQGKPVKTSTSVTVEF